MKERCMMGHIVGRLDKHQIQNISTSEIKGARLSKYRWQYGLSKRFVTEKFTYSGEQSLLHSFGKFFSSEARLNHLCLEDLLQFLAVTRTTYFLSVSSRLELLNIFTRHYVICFCNFKSMIRTWNLKLLYKIISSVDV